MINLTRHAAELAVAYSVLALNGLRDGRFAAPVELHCNIFIQVAVVDISQKPGEELNGQHSGNHYGDGTSVISMVSRVTIKQVTNRSGRYH